jgi:5-formyltetrahydrofolate cyclo-ligase
MEIYFHSFFKGGHLLMTEDQKKCDKAQWRRQLTAMREDLSIAEREQFSQRLCDVVEQHVLQPLRVQVERPLRLCVYAPFRSEASPLTLVQWCWDKGDVIAAPRMLPAGEGMELRQVQSLSHWIVGKWGVPEPDPLQTYLIDRTQSLDVVLVPGLAFNQEGGRLGYGGGYYDRLYAQEIANGHYGTLWIGFAYSNQVITEPLPIEAHDLRLKGLATDKEILWFK